MWHQFHDIVWMSPRLVDGHLVRHWGDHGRVALWIVRKLECHRDGSQAASPVIVTWRGASGVGVGGVWWIMQNDADGKEDGRRCWPHEWQHGQYDMAGPVITRKLMAYCFVLLRLTLFGESIRIHFATYTETNFIHGWGCHRCPQPGRITHIDTCLENWF